MSTTIHFQGGVSTSGGTIIEVKHGRHRLVFDFGFVFDPPRHVFDGTIRPGGPSYIADLLNLGLLPRIDGLFPAGSLDDVESVSPASGEADSTMVLISHPHEDHVGGVGLIDSSVPVVMSEDAAILLRALADLDQFDLPREVTGVRVGKVFSFGPFEIVARYSDHPAWGSVGFEISTPDGRIFWTGDWRLHGRGRERVLAELAATRQAGIALLITEGTTLGSELPVHSTPRSSPPGTTVMADGLLTEDGVDEALAEVLAAPGPVFLNTYNRDFSPLQNVITLAARHGRRIAVQLEIAVIIERLTGVLLPVYVGRHGLDDAKKKSDAARSTASKAHFVTASDVADDPSGWVVQLGYAQTTELLAFRGLGGTYLHLGGTPLGGPSPELQRLERVLATVGIVYSRAGRYTHFAHATPGHIALLTELVAPRHVAIVHAPYSEQFQPLRGERVTVGAGVTLSLDNGEIFPMS